MTEPNPTPDESVHVIACAVLAPDVRHVAERLGVTTTMEFLPGGLHARPDELRRRLQERIDRACEFSRGQRIVVGYGVCGLGTVGLCARNVPLAIPRVNDCIALLLGSDAAYRDEFARCPGTYYVSAGWVEEKSQPQTLQDAPIHCGPECFTFGQLIERYGEENAEAIRAFLGSWQRNYQRAAFIDTGVPGRRRHYAELAQAMAAEFGWRYEEIAGSHELLVKLVTARRSTDEVLLVPPHHVTVHDPMRKTLTAVPVWESDQSPSGGDHTLVFEGETLPGAEDGDRSAEGQLADSSSSSPLTPTLSRQGRGRRLSGAGSARSDSVRSGPAQSRPARMGLGIDAGGTYTDVVLYDFDRDEVVAKAKSLTTKWDFTLGIGEALDRLDPAALRRVDLVSISTTLATNAIVEGRGQKVGLLIFPPYGLFDPSDIAYRPIAVLDGKLEIDGRQIAPVAPEQARREIRRMVDREQVAALAVSGYASHVNPSHELEVKAIIERETGLGVTCAHELSEKANYRVRSVTAALNAGIIPCLESFLSDVDEALQRRAIAAPRMVVRSDGTLMSLPRARLRPIETILSGPAASVAGASHLARLENAMVVDMGGTTTDTATIRRGAVETCRRGASVGGWRTHVDALDLRTLGLGGDSLIERRRDGRLTIGPWRVAPVAWTLRHGDGDRALDWLDANLDRFRTSTQGIELLAATDGDGVARLSAEEKRLLDALADGPCSLDELARRLDARHWRFVPWEPLERRHLVLRSSLTPSDLLHATGRLDLWNADAAKRFGGFFCRLLGLSERELARFVHDTIVRRLATELLKKQLAETTDAEGLEQSGTTAALVENWLDRGTDDYRVRVALEYPVVGIGAPVHVYLPDAAERLETEAVIPPHADVANAIGAITSRVSIRRNLEIAPAETGRYAVAGLPDVPSFASFEAAHEFAVDELVRIVRRQAREAGTSEARVEVHVHDRVGVTSGGGHLFLGRHLTAQLSGRPDLGVLAEAR